MQSFCDHTGKLISIHYPPKRIISLVPSITELLYDLELDDRIIGVTKFCIHPSTWAHPKIRIGGTKQVNITLIKDLKPDLVIANKEENVKEQVEWIENICPVYTTVVDNVTTAVQMIRDIGIITDKEKKGNEIADQINLVFDKKTNLFSQRALYLIWKKPYMAAGGDTFIHDMMLHAGFENVLADQRRYPVLNENEIQALEPDVLLLSSEPYPFSQKHVQEFEKLLPQTKILMVDGEMFSWYGSRMLKSINYFQTIQRQLSNEKSTL